ncbi:unnamed protein product [Sphenostylis stenocarpa]|uniref:Uncharacterized protein n=1 Tax=Sphenostylis stenocarpa TaxID=92480 RepID=A0AA86VEF9_9FABA|nr:unnamed protein product [Sphenostylis stenocarpa]
MSALFLKASVSKKTLGSWLSSTNRVTVTSTTRPIVPQWPTVRFSGRTARLGPTPHRTAQTPTRRYNHIWSSDPKKGYRIYNEPCLHQPSKDGVMSSWLGVGAQRG